MKKLFFVLLILIAGNSFGQEPEFLKNECKFFDYLKEIREKNYENDTYRALLKNEEEKRLLLKQLEKYLVVFAGDSIAPMYLSIGDNEQQNRTNSFIESHPYYCADYVNEYYKLMKGIHIRKARNDFQKLKRVGIKELLLDLTDLNKDINSQVEKYLAEFEQSFTLQYLYSCITEKESKLPKLTIEQNQQYLIGRLDKHGQKIYTHYENYSSKPNVLKGYEMYHENDVLLFSKKNQDREMTGGFKFTFITDYFKCRWFPLGTQKQTQQNVLTYQSISIGGSGYTPYIRYYNNTILADSIHKYDRPFCSYMYLERAKHRTWLRGLVRQNGEFQAGMIGTNGYLIQAKLHEDVNVDAQHVYGWDKQIAEEGRLYLQVNQKWDLMLFSTSNKYRTIFRPRFIRVENPNSKKKYCGANISSEFDVRFGSLMTSVGGGIRFSTLNFLQQSGHQMISSVPYSRPWFRYSNLGFKLDAGVSYRYVVHNSTLEGLGFTKKFPDDKYDIVKPDDYVLSWDQIKRHLIIIDFGLNIKFRKTTLFYRYLLQTPEYESRLSLVDYSRLEYLVSFEDKENYRHKIPKEQKAFSKYKLYGYGTIGLSWIID